jgi:hypothetical protein
MVAVLLIGGTTIGDYIYADLVNKAGHTVTCIEAKDLAARNSSLKAFKTVHFDPIV